MSVPLQYDGSPVRVLQFAGVDRTLRFMLPLSRALAAEGFAVYGAASRSAANSDLTAAGLTFLELPIPRQLRPMAILRAISATARLLRRLRIDIIHAHTYAGGVIGRAAGWLAGTPCVIYQGHGWLYTPDTTPWKKRLIQLSELALAPVTDRFFLISREEYEIGLADRIIQPAKSVVTLGVGVDCGRFDPAQVSGETRRRLRQQYGVRPEDYVFCFVGRPVGDKGILELGRAFAVVHRLRPQTRLLIIGGAAAGERDTGAIGVMQAQLERDGCRDAVVLAGQLSDPRDLLASCDAFVLPSYREGMPVSLMEAMALEIPCIATDIPGCREEVIDGQTGWLVPPRTVEPLAGRMLELASDQALARRLGQAARRRMLELFSLDKVLAVQVEAYRAIRRRLRCRFGANGDW